MFQTLFRPPSTHRKAAGEKCRLGWRGLFGGGAEILRFLENALLTDFVLLTSAMHMVWLRHIGGRLKSDYRYSIGLVYNTFPMPPNLRRAHRALDRAVDRLYRRTGFASVRERVSTSIHAV